MGSGFKTIEFLFPGFLIEQPSAAAATIQALKARALIVINIINYY
jgi:hypothetical protein